MKGLKWNRRFYVAAKRKEETSYLVLTDEGYAGIAQRAPTNDPFNVNFRPVRELHTEVIIERIIHECDAAADVPDWQET